MLVGERTGAARVQRPAGRPRAVSEARRISADPGEVLWALAMYSPPAIINGVQPRRFLAFTSAPFSIRYLTIDGWLQITAPCSAVMSAKRGSPVPRSARSWKLSG